MSVYPSSWNLLAAYLPTSANGGLTSGDWSYLTHHFGFDDALPLPGNQEGWGSVRGSTFTYDTTPPASSLSSR